MSGFRDSWAQDDYAKKRWQSDYDDYLKRIEQYKGSSFYNELLNNPYMQFQNYQANFFQGVWANTTEDYSAWDKFYNDRKTSADEYMAQILDAQRQQAYDSPQAQVDRRAAAGLNDALSGGSAIGPGESAEAAPDDTPPESQYQDPLSVAVQVGQIGFNLMQSGMSLLSFFQDQAGKRLDNGLKDLALTGEGYDQAIKMLAGSSSLPETRDEYDALSEQEKAGLDDQLIQQLEASLSQGRYKGMYRTRTARRMMRTLRGVVSYDKNGKPTLAYETYRSKLLAERYGSHKQAAEVFGTPGFSESVVEFGTRIADTFGNIDLAIRKAQQRISQATATSAEAQASYDQGALTNARGAAEATAAIDVAGAQSIEAQNAKIIADMRKDINEQFDALWELAKHKGGFEGMLLKLLIPTARAQTEQIIQNGFGATALQRSGLNGAVGAATGALLK